MAVRLGEGGGRFNAVGHLVVAGEIPRLFGVVRGGDGHSESLP